MAKELLIVEEPIVCDMCWLSVQKAKGVYCRYKHRYNEEHKKPTWCPLKPMPQKYQIGIEYDVKKGATFDDYIEVGCKIGWDACIDEILGEQNGDI